MNDCTQKFFADEKLWRYFLLLGCAYLAACATPAVVFVSPSYDSKQISRVAVIGIDDFPGAAGSGNIVSDIVEQYLIPLNYNIIEREQVQQILQEQSFDTSGAVDAATAQSMGKLLGADALVLGSITDFSQSSEQTVMVDMPQESMEPIYGQASSGPRGGGGGRGRGGWGGGGQPVVTGYTTSESDQVVPETETLPAHIGLTVRMVSVKTGAILWSGSDSSDGNDISGAAQSVTQSIMQSLKAQLAQLSVPAS